MQTQKKDSTVVHVDFRQPQPFDIHAFARERGVKLEDALKRDDCDDVRVMISVGKLRKMLGVSNGH